MSARLRGVRSPERLAVVAFACVAVLAAAWILREGRGLTFFYDEWNWVLERRHGFDGLFEPHEGHLVVVPLLVFKALFAVVGVEPYWPYRLLAVLAHVLCAGLLFALVRRRLGDWLGLAAATVLLLLGAAWQVLLWPLEISFTLSVAAGLGALLALDAGTRRGDVVAAGCVLLALGSSGLGVAVAAGVFAELVLVPAHRRRVWVVVAPLALYAVWYLAASPESQVQVANLDAAPRYVGDAAAGAVGAVTGLNAEFGRVLLVLAAVLVVRRLIAPGPLPVRLVAVLTMALVYWGLLALARADLAEPVASRYVYFGGVLVLLIVACAVVPRPLGVAGWGLLSLAVLASVLSNVGDLRHGASGVHGVTNDVRAALAAVELAGDAVAAQTQPEPMGAPQIRAGDYRALVSDDGSPVGGAEGVLDDGESTRIAVDAALARVLGVAVTPAADGAPAAGAPPGVVAAIGGRARSTGSCVLYTAAGSGAALDLRLAPGTSIVLRDATKPAELRLRRMSEAFSTGPIGTVAAGATVRLAVPRDAIARPWVLRASPGGSLRACGGA